MKARFLALAALVLGLASCQNDPEIVNPVVGGEVDFQLAVSATELGTRAENDKDNDGQYGFDSAYGAIDYLCVDADPLRTDWTEIDLRYSLEVYDVASDYTDAVPVKDRQVIIVDKYEPVAFNLRLVPGRTYRFVVFADFVPQGSYESVDEAISAQKNLGLHHTIGDNLGQITIKKDKINAEVSDAYFAVKDITISNSAAQDMTLTRPYGKLRVVATDLADLNLNIEPVSVTVTYAAAHPSAFNAVNGKISGDYTTNTYTYFYNNGVCKADLSNHIYTEGYDNIDYKPAVNANGDVRHSHMTLFTDYILAKESQEPIQFEMEVKHANGTIKKTSFSTDIPVQRNHLTTIVGNVLTTATEINVTINDNFSNANDSTKEPFYQEVWDGETLTEPTITTDATTGEAVALINQASDLAWLASFVNGTLIQSYDAESEEQNFEGVKFVLNNNIDLNNEPWTPIGFNPNDVAGNEKFFTGEFDGNGFVISNLYIDVKDQGGVGLFGTVNNATIKNFTLRNVFVKAVESENDPANASGAEGKAEYIAGGHIGAVVGYDAAPWGTGAITFENVHVDGLIKIEGETRAAQGQRVGGIIGGRGYSKITFNNVSVIGDEGSYIKGYCSTAGVIGQGQGVSTFSNVTTDIPVYAVTFGAGGISGIACNGSTFTNCSSKGDVTLDASKTQLSSYSANYPFRIGGIAGCWSDSKSAVLTLTDCSYEGNLTSIDKDGNSPEAFDYAGYVGRGYALKNCAGSKVKVNNDEYVQVYDNVYGVYYVNGAYEVNTAADLKALANDVNAGNTFDGKTVVLTADIDLKNENWTPIGYWQTFNGTFDGQNHTISNLKHHGTEEDCYVGLFGYTENATIKNLTINNVDLKLIANASWAGGHMGALVGNIEGETVIENITVSGNVKIDGDMEKAGAGRIGGVVGGNVSKVSLKNVVVNANEGSFVKGNSSIGGIAGQLQGETTFENCSSNINVSAQQFYAGGIIGLTYRITSFTNCTASGNISVLAGRAGNDNDLYRVGGIAGGWDEDDNGEYVLPLVNCSTTCVLAGASADGRTATAFDCDGFVGRGYGAKVGAQVSVNGTVYEYVGEGVYKIGDSYVVNTGDALVAALAKEYNVTFGKDLKIDPANMSNAYGKTGVLVYKGQSIDGAGHKLDVKGAGGTWDSGICTSGGLIKNLWVTGSFRGVFVKGATHTEKVVLENVRLEGTTYTISCDSASGQGLEARNSIFRGWTSYAKTIGNVKFDGCTFGAGNGYNFSRPYAPTEYVNCTFEAGHQIDPRAAITFENCTLNGVALTAENLSTLVVSNIANATIK